MRSIEFTSGHLLAYTEYGDPKGYPVYFFHGIPGSRLFRPPDPITERLGVRLICIDRPGYGDSDFQPGRRILDWPDNVLALAVRLGTPKFAVAGHSGGGPYSAVCAYALPNRVSAAAIISGIGPIDSLRDTRGMGSKNRIGFWVGSWAPWWYWRFLNWFFFRNAHRYPEKLFPDNQAGSVRSDRDVLSDPKVLELCRASVREGFRQGLIGHAWEGRLLSRPWNFNLRNITIPVHVWHGELDIDTPIQMGRRIAKYIPQSKSNFLPDTGHLLIFQHWEAILSLLLANIQS